MLPTVIFKSKRKHQIHNFGNLYSFISIPNPVIGFRAMLELDTSSDCLGTVFLTKDFCCRHSILLIVPTAKKEKKINVAQDN